jgi:hypothetical protein
MNHKNRGKFTLAGEMLRNDFTTMIAIMKDVVVFHTEARFDRDEITYFACHPDFEEIDTKLMVPEYEAMVTSYGKTVISVEWRKK